MENIKKSKLDFYIEKRIRRIILIIIVLFVTLCIFGKPIAWAYYSHGTFEFETTYGLKSVLLLYEDEEKPKSGAPIVKYSQDGDTLSITLPDIDKDIKIDATNFENLLCSYSVGDDYYFILQGWKEFWLPMTAKSHKSDKLVRINAKTLKADDIYESKSGELIICGDNNEALIFDSKNVSLNLISYENGNSTEVAKLDNKKQIKHIDFTLTKDTLSIKAKYKRKSNIDPVVIKVELDKIK